MEYVRSDPERGHLYRCRTGGCQLLTRKGVRYCDDQVWEKAEGNLRLFGPTGMRRNSQEWNDLYAKRWSIERTFKSLKQSRRLERHYIRGIAQVRLHCLMAVLTYQATVLVSIQAGSRGRMRWMVAKVA